MRKQQDESKMLLIKHNLNFSRRKINMCFDSVTDPVSFTVIINKFNF